MQKTKLIDIRKALERIDIGKEPIVFLHSSVFQLGQIENGLDGILQVLWDWLGAEGTLLMPAFSYHNNKEIPWKAKTTSAKTGVLTEYFRKSSGVLRSLHPIHSIAAAGKYAEYFVSGVEASSFGKNSCFAKLINADALNIGLGIGFIGGATFLHFAEEKCRISYRYYQNLEVIAYDMDDKVIDEQYLYFARVVMRDFEYLNNWDNALKDLIEKKLFIFDNIGSAVLMHARMKDSVGLLMEKIKFNEYYCAERINILD